jgi:hypothetical protein
MYYCNNCDTEISDDDIVFDDNRSEDSCPHCESSNVDYFNCDVSEGAKNTEQAQPTRGKQ